MNFKEKLSPSAQKKLSDLLFILYAGGAALLSYSLVYALRKPFTAATFDGMELFGMDYKIATSIIQIFGYMVSKFIGIKLISELKREGRLKFILVSILVAELSLVLFGCLPRPFNVLALFFNGLSLGCMWGVIFSFLEGRRVTDLLASLFGLSIAVSSGTAKSIGLFVVDTLHVSEFWMPALIGAVALPLLAGLGYILDHLPKPTAEDKALRVERVTLNKQQRWNLFRSFAPILTLLRQPLSHRFARCQGRLSGENHRRQCRRTFPVGIRQSGRCSHTDYPGYFRHPGSDEKPHQSTFRSIDPCHCGSNHT